jgi:hypothetical protein
MIAGEDPYGADWVSDLPDDWVLNSDPHGLEVAWTEVQVELGSWGSVAGVQRLNTPDQWVAEASGPHRLWIRGYGYTPVVAMNDLHDRVRESKGPKPKRL